MLRWKRTTGGQQKLPLRGKGSCFQFLFPMLGWEVQLSSANNTPPMARPSITFWPSQHYGLPFSCRLCPCIATYALLPRVYQDIQIKPTGSRSKEQELATWCADNYFKKGGWDGLNWQIKNNKRIERGDKSKEFYTLKFNANGYRCVQSWIQSNKAMGIRGVNIHTSYGLGMST